MTAKMMARRRTHAARFDDGMGFRLAPSQPVLDQRLGQHFAGVDWGLDASEGSAVSDLLADQDRSGKYYRHRMAIRRSIGNLDDRLWTISFE